MTATRKRISFVLAILMIVSMLFGLVTPVYAAEKIGTIYQVDYPRGGMGTVDDWGHPAMNFMGGWSVGEATDFAIRSEGTYTGQLLYCIEIGVRIRSEDNLTSKGEYFWENYPDNLNPTIDPDTIKSYIGRILVYGYQGNCSTNYDMSDPSDQDAMAHIIATQLLIWETVVGERDENFELVNASAYGKDAVADTIAAGHPLRSRIFSHYNSIVNSVQNHAVAPSFMSKSRGSARTYEMEWDGSQYILELTDTNGVLSNYTFSSSTSGVKMRQSGNKLVITADEAPASGVTISATKGSSRMSLITWTDGNSSNINNGQIQDLVTWGERVSDPVYAYLNIKVSYGEAKIVKHSEDDNVSGIKFNITGNGINKTVATGNDGSVEIPNLAPGVYTQTVYYPTPVEITTFFTNDEGWMMLPYELDYGRYELIELQTAYGYVLDSEPVPFEVDGSETIVTVEKHNMPQKGVIKIRKNGEVFQSVSEQDGLFQPVYEVQPLAGAEYTVIAAEDIVTLDGTVRYEKGQLVATIITGADGWAATEPLYLGKYTVTESKAPDKMVLNPEPQTVELTYAGQEVSLTETSANFYNERQKVEISLAKAMEVDEVFGLGINDELAGVTFGLYAAEDLTAADGNIIPADGLIEIVSINADGSASCQTDLPLGNFYLQERTTDNRYLIGSEKYPVTFDYAGQEVPTVKLAVNGGNTIVNKLIYGSVTGMKLDEDGSGLGGAVIGLFAADAEEFTRETALLVTESAEDGSFAFEKVPYGTWYIREIEQPSAAYLLCTEVFPVEIIENESVIEISITNERVRGNISLTKVDADYPDNKLSGAEFEVYRDVNGNKELDKEDELLGMMEETEPGFYEMEDIEYGGVLVREKIAPEGFYLDESVYYVSVETDGETYVIENSAGVGFINQAHRGNLKIVKSSSDGKVEGFAFRFVGEDYDRTFVTDANGIILIENLRVGEYTVTELEDELSAGYKRPDPVTVELVVNETLTVNVHNEKVTVDVPKTGDDADTWLWIGLMAACVLGAGAAGTVLVIRKKKAAKAENN